MTTRLLPALEIGGTHVAAALVSAATWQVIPHSRRRQPLHAHDPAETILAAVLDCANALGAPELKQWGIALPGPFDYALGIGLFEGVAKFEGLYGVNVRRALLDGLRPPAAEVFFINDADAFLLGEWVAGAASGLRRVVGITLGTGVGSAFLADGVVIADDPTVPPEGRVDLLTIAGRPLEETVSRRAILARYAELSRSQTAGGFDVREVAERARSGEAVAGEVLDQAMVALGEVLAPWLMRFGATALVVGGSMSGSWDLLARPLRAGMARSERTLPERITLLCAEHPDDAALIGAAWHAAGGFRT